MRCAKLLLLLDSEEKEHEFYCNISTYWNNLQEHTCNKEFIHTLWNIQIHNNWDLINIKTLTILFLTMNKQTSHCHCCKMWWNMCKQGIPRLKHVFGGFAYCSAQSTGRADFQIAHYTYSVSLYSSTSTTL